MAARVTREMAAVFAETISPTQRRSACGHFSPGKPSDTLARGTKSSSPTSSSGESCKLRAARDTPSSGSSNEGSADPLASLRSEPKKAWSSLRSGAGSARLYPARQGVTRGKRLVVLLGQRTALAIAVKGARTRRRWSKLGEWLGRAVTTLMPCAGCNPG